MLKAILIILLNLSFAANIQILSQSFCQDTKILSIAGKMEKYVYKTYLDSDGDEKKLYLGLVRPVDNLPDKKRPLIIGVHSGGFLDICFFKPCYVKYSEGFLNREFIPQGVVTASIEYRLNSLFALKPPKIDDEKLKEAHYKAVQDVRQAVKYIFENADKLGVDTESVFLVGTSAGAITVLHTAFLENEEVSKDLMSKFGPLAEKKKIKGVISFSGAIYDLSYLDDKDKVPLMVVHGTDDGMVPIDKGFYLNKKHLTPVYGDRAVYEDALKKGFPVKGFFYDYGHSLPRSLSKEVFKNVNDFIRSNSGCAVENTPVISAQ